MVHFLKSWLFGTVFCARINRRSVFEMPGDGSRILGQPLNSTFISGFLLPVDIGRLRRTDQRMRNFGEPDEFFDHTEQERLRRWAGVWHTIKRHEVFRLENFYGRAHDFYPRAELRRELNVEGFSDDRFLVLAALSQDYKDLGCYLDVLELASEVLRADKEIVNAAVAQNSRALRHAAEPLKDDKAFVLAILKTSPRRGQTGHSSWPVNPEHESLVHALACASDRLRADKEVVLAAVAQNGLALLDAHEAFRSDKEVVLAAVAQHAIVLHLASPALQSDREVVVTALAAAGPGFVERLIEGPMGLPQGLWRDLKEDKDFVLEAVAQNGSVLKHASETLKADKSVVLAAVAQNGRVLEHASEALKADKAVVLTAVTQDGGALGAACLFHAKGGLMGNKDFVLEVVAKNGCALEYASRPLRADRDVVLKAVLQHSDAFCFALGALPEDREIVLAAVKQAGHMMREAAGILKSDREFVLEAVAENGYALSGASPELQNDKEVVLTAVAQIGCVLHAASEALKGDPEVVLTAMKQDVDSVGFASAALRKDPAFVRRAVVDFPDFSTRIVELCEGPQDFGWTW